MKIALLAPPYLSVPPQTYGGTERIVSLLADGLVDKGHDVTLFASGDSKTKAKLVSIFPNSLGNSGLKKGDSLLPLLHYHACFKHEGPFDIIHNHAQYLAMIISDFSKVPVVHTIHGSYYPDEVPDSKRDVLDKLKHHRFISISQNQRGGFPQLNFVGTVYNGLVPKDYSFNSSNGRYLLWVGRITEKKGPLEAIETAKKTGMQLKIAADVDPIDRGYFENEILPAMDRESIMLMGDLKQEELHNLYQNAFCTLFPIHWHEPFGLVMIESMVCGTPVIGYRIGAVPEVIKDGVTGFVVDDNEQMVDAVKKIHTIDRKNCRQWVEDNFTAQKMVNEYERIYKEILETK